MTSRSDDKSKAKTEIDSGDALLSQDKTIRRLSDRLESLAAVENAVVEEQSSAGAKQAAINVDIDVDIDAELIKSELEKIATEGEISWPEMKRVHAPNGVMTADASHKAEAAKATNSHRPAMPAAEVPTFDPPENSHIAAMLSSKNLSQPEKPGSSLSPNISASQASLAAEENDGGEQAELSETMGAAAADDPEDSAQRDDLWMGEEIGAPRPTPEFPKFHSRTREVPIRTEFAAMQPEHEYRPDTAGSDSFAYGQDTTGKKTELPQLSENTETAIDLTEGLRSDYPELRPLREPPQDSMLGFYVSLALVFICSTFGTLYVLNQLDSNDESAGLEPNMIAPISPADSMADAGDVSGTTLPEIAATAESESAAAGEKAKHPLLAALDNSAAEKFTASSPTGTSSPVPSQKFTVENVSGQAGVALPVDIALPPEQFDEQAYLVFRGMPKELSLSKGHKRDDSWAVRASELSGLALNTPEGFSGSFIMEVILVRSEEAAPETRVSAVDITPAVSTAAKETTPGSMEGNTPAGVARVDQDEGSTSTATAALAGKTPGHEVSETTEHQVRTLSESQEISMLSRGGNLMDDGDIAGARLIFEYLAEQGSALGAVAFAKSFDPNLFEKGYIRGPEPSAEEAMKWYRRAAELGNKEAISRLNTLRSMTKTQ